MCGGKAGWLVCARDTRPLNSRWSRLTRGQSPICCSGISSFYQTLDSKLELHTASIPARHQESWFRIHSVMLCPAQIKVGEPHLRWTFPGKYLNLIDLLRIFLTAPLSRWQMALTAAQIRGRRQPVGNSWQANTASSENNTRKKPLLSLKDLKGQQNCWNFPLL